MLGLNAVGTPMLIDGRFAIEAEVGAGGMGTVYRARDTKTGDTVALKVHTASSSPSIERFGREARLLASLTHPNIVGYVSHGLIDGKRLYVAMEWVEGEDLHSRLTKRGLTLGETISAVLDVSYGLDHIHSQGILHRDLKPSNVMIVGNHAKIIDFGLARRMREEHKVTQTGMALGTPGYMAPEQIRGAKDYDARVDVFALGCLFYECVTGCPAFFGATWLAVQAKILVKSVVPPRSLGIVMPDSVAALLDQMLAKEPAQRTPDIATVIKVLQEAGPVDESVRQTFKGPIATTRKEPATWRYPAEPEYLVVAMAGRLEAKEIAVIEPLVGPHGGTLVQLADGALVVRIERGGEEPAMVRAARVALALRFHDGSWPISVIDNRVENAIDDATRQMDANEMAMLFKRVAAVIRIDDETAAALAGRFNIGKDENGPTLGAATVVPT